MKCPSCDKPKAQGHYLCTRCWYGLGATTRYALNRKDPAAGQRLLELHRELRRDVPLSEIRVTP